MKRVFLIVLDSVGMGEMPDAAEYGEAGSNTILEVSKSPYFSMPNMKKLGYFNIDGMAVNDKEETSNGSVCKNDGKLERKGYNHRTLGDCGNYF